MYAYSSKYWDESKEPVYLHRKSAFSMSTNRSADWNGNLLLNLFLLLSDVLQTLREGSFKLRFRQWDSILAQMAPFSVQKCKDRHLSTRRFYQSNWLRSISNQVNHARKRSLFFYVFCKEDIFWMWTVWRR